MKDEIIFFIKLTNKLTPSTEANTKMGKSNWDVNFLTEQNRIY